MNELYLKRMKEYLGEEYELLLNAYNQAPVRSIRLNNISLEKLKSNLDIPLEKIEYDLNGYYLLNDNKYGNHPYHHLGAIYFQEPSAMMPVNLYNFKGDELVIDLCASPGGKSSQILQRIPNGVLFSCEPNKSRAQVLFGNLERMGFKNAVVINNRPEEITKYFEGIFDVVLVDAPCSGEGMMRKDKEAEAGWNINNIAECVERDKIILDNANKLLKEGGHLIYSTCTFAKEEDEDMIEYILSMGYEIESVPEYIKAHTKEGFLPNTRRFYPYVSRGEGQFMCLLKKVSKSNEYYRIRKPDKLNSELSIVKDFIKENTSYDYNNIIKEGNRYYIPCTNYDFKGLNVLNYGIELGEVSKNRFIPYHHLYKALGNYFNNKVILDVNDNKVLHYLRGEEITCDAPNGYGVILIDNIPLGGFKASNNQLKNHYPKGLRNINLIEE